MNPTEKTRLLEYSAGPRPRKVKNWQRYELVQKMNANGAPIFDGSGGPIMERAPVKSWTFDFTAQWLRRTDYQLARSAADQGWHMRLLDFVSKQHRLPRSDEFSALIEQQQEIDMCVLPDAHRKKVNGWRDLLSAQMELKAAE